MTLSPRLSASHAVRGAVLGGLLAPVESMRCVDCQRQAQAYHHHLGYAPEHRLDVVALCDRCHMARHQSVRGPRTTRDRHRRFPPMARKKRPEHGERLPRLNVEVYPEEEVLLRQARMRAAELGETLHDLVMRALRNEIAREQHDG